MTTSVSQKRLSESSVMRDRIWPLSESVGVLILLQIILWVGYLLGWFAGYEAGGLR